MTHIELDLGRHCIATEVKRLHNRCISDYFKKRGEMVALEAKIALLTQALDELDLPALRGVYPPLAGGDAVAVVLGYTAQGGIAIRLDGNSLDLSMALKG